MTNKQYPSFSRKDLALVTFGHRNAKGDLKTPQNLLLLFFVGDSNVYFSVGLHYFIPTIRNLCVIKEPAFAS